MLEAFFQETTSLPQLLGWGAVVMGVIRYQFKTANSIRLANAVTAVFFIAHFGAMEAYAGMVIACVAATRGFSLSFERVRQHKKTAGIIAMTAAYAGVALTGNATDWTVLLALLGTTMSCFEDLQEKAIHMRYFAVFRQIFWFAYNFSIGSHGGMVNNFIAGTSNLVGWFRHHWRKS